MIVMVGVADIRTNQGRNGCINPHSIFAKNLSQVLCPRQSNDENLAPINPGSLKTSTNGLCHCRA